MTTGALIPNGEQQFLDGNGAPLAGGFVYTYVPGTTTPSTTWVDQNLTTANTNPILLDSAGRCVIWGTGSYRQIVTDLNGNLIWDVVTSDGGSGEIAGLQSDVTTLQADVSALQAAGLQLSVIMQTSTYTIKSSKILVIGLGGGGGGAGSSGVTAPGTGGAGGTFFRNLSGLTIGNTLNVTIGAGGNGGGTGTGAGLDGSATTVESGSQTIATLTANGGHGAPSQTASGRGGNVLGAFPLNLHGQDGYRADDTVAIAGRAAMFFPFGTGGSLQNNGQIIVGNPVANQDGTQGLVLILGVW